MKTILPFIKATLSALALFLAANSNIFAQTSTLLIDFGAQQSANAFGLAAWNTPLTGSNVAYSSLGPGGVIVANDPDEYTDFMGISGTPRQFKRGDRIVATWYNTSTDTIYFTARISFRDSDIPEGGAVFGLWYTMRRFTDYRYTYCKIAPRATMKTAFNIEPNGVHKTDSTYRLVNLNLHIEWNLNDNKRALLCDKIELMNDADIMPPSAPTSVRVTSKTDNQIRVAWNPSADNTGVVEYLIYMDGAIEGYSRSTDFTAVLLEPSTKHSFKVTALDHCGNESVQSSPVIDSTTAFAYVPDRIEPRALQYLGAMRMPEPVNWGGEALAYNPLGDGGPTGSGAADGFPGSLFTTNINTPTFGFVGEVTIPAPKITKNIDALNEAAVLQAFSDVRPANVNSWPFVDVWNTGLCCITDGGAAQPQLYSTWGFYYQVTGEKNASVSFCDANNLKSSVRRGAWLIGGATSPPMDAALNDYLCAAPIDWANAHASGRRLITGRNREGGLSGLGPTMYAVAPVQPSSPPPPGSELATTPLVQYGPVENADDYNFPLSFIGYNHADWFRGIAWLTDGSRSAVALIGNKGRGNCWYGYTGERMRHDWVIADVPYPDYGLTDPDGKGWRAHTKVPMIAFYSTATLASVAEGKLQPNSPQPYAALRIDPSVLFGVEKIIRDVVFDAARRILYVYEFLPERDGLLILHAWKVYQLPTNVEHLDPVASTCSVYPQPANDMLRISVSPRERIESVTIWNALGQMMRRVDGAATDVSISELRDGVYHVCIATSARSYRKMVVVVR